MWLLRADNRAASPAVFEAFRKFVHTAPHLEVLRCEATFRHAQSNTFLDGGDGRLAVKLKVLDCSRTLRGVRVCSVAHRRRLSRPACVWSAALGAVVTVAMSWCSAGNSWGLQRRVVTSLGRMPVLSCMKLCANLQVLNVAGTVLPVRGQLALLFVADRHTAFPSCRQRMADLTQQPRDVRDGARRGSAPSFARVDSRR